MVGTKKLDWFPNTIYFTANKGKYNKMKTTNRIIIFFAPYAGTRFLSTSITIWLCLFSTFTLSLSYLWWISSRNCFTSDFFADFIEKIIFPSIVSKIKWELSDVSETTVLLISVNASPKGKEEKFFAILIASPFGCLVKCMTASVPSSPSVPKYLSIFQKNFRRWKQNS